MPVASESIIKFKLALPDNVKRANVEVDKIGSCLSLGFGDDCETSCTVTPATTIFGTLVWTPVNAGPMRAVVQMKLNGRFKLQATATGLAVKLKLPKTGEKNVPLSRRKMGTPMSSCRSPALLSVRKQLSELTEGDESIALRENAQAGIENQQQRSNNPESKFSAKIIPPVTPQPSKKIMSINSTQAIDSTKLYSQNENTSQTFPQSQAAKPVLAPKSRRSVKDRKWAEKQIHGFEGWLNYTFYPPQDLCSAAQELGETAASVESMDARSLKLLLSQRHMSRSRSPLGLRALSPRRCVACQALMSCRCVAR